MRNERKVSFVRMIILLGVLCVIAFAVLFCRDIWNLFHRQQLLVENVREIRNVRFLIAYEETEVNEQEIIAIIGQIRCREIPFWQRVEMADNQYSIEFDLVNEEEQLRSHWTVFLINRNHLYLCSDGNKEYEIINYGEITDQIRGLSEDN